MRQLNEENERIKHEYLKFIAQVDGRDEATIDKVAASLLSFEEAIGFKHFKAFHRDWAITFKRHLAERKNARTGKPIGLSTRDSTLRQVQAFFRWLASQKGYKSRITSEDVRYFNNNMKDARTAHAQRPPRYPSLDQCDHAFRLMPEGAEIEKRDKALFALWVMTGARSSALASFRLHHVDLFENVVFQDAREVRTKGAKSFETWFFPVNPMYREFLACWIAHLTEVRLFGPGDALFPKQTIGVVEGKFASEGLATEPYANSEIVTRAIKGAFRRAGLFEFKPHSIRTTLINYGDKLCNTMAERKAWSQNLGHENIITSYVAYMPIDRERQGELIRRIQA